MWLFLAFLAVPLIEIALFIQVGGAIGLWPALGIVVFTAILGTYLVRSQGAMVMGQIRQSFSELSDPAEPLAHGAMILFSGALLLTPGFFTDAVGFALMIPAIRKAAYQAIRSRVKVQQFQMGPQPRPTDPADQVIDGDYEDLDQPRKPRQGPSGWTKH